MNEVYCDGGVIGRNPSTIGGTWAYVVPHTDGTCTVESGVVTPQEAGLPVITNNYTELFAVVKAMENLPEGWDGTIFTDSNVTVSRIVRRRKPPKFEGIPADLQLRLAEARKRIVYDVVLIAGHPTKEELRLGKNHKGTPVSKWNVIADEACETAGSDDVRR